MIWGRARREERAEGLQRGTRAAVEFYVHYPDSTDGFVVLTVLLPHCPLETCAAYRFSHTSLKLCNTLHFLSPHLGRFNSFVAMLVPLPYPAQNYFWPFPHSLPALPEPGFSWAPLNIERSVHKDKQQSRVAKYFLLKHILKSEEKD